MHMIVHVLLLKIKNQSCVVLASLTCAKSGKHFFALDSAKLKDSFDGNIWMDFQSPQGKPFLVNEGGICLMLNIDWFQPFKHRQYSVGVIYLVIMNLPMKLRFKQENLLLVGRIPGPREPPTSMNSYLQHLVKYLLVLWEGIPLLCGQRTVTLCCALGCVACYLPAGKKACRFLSYSANLGCSLSLLP